APLRAARGPLRVRVHGGHPSLGVGRVGDQPEWQREQLRQTIERNLPMIRHPLVRPPAGLRPTPSRPANHRLPPLLRLGNLAPAGEQAQGEFARDAKVANVEAALFLADEPLAPRKLAAVAGLKDTAEAREVVGRLREL